MKVETCPSASQPCQKNPIQPSPCQSIDTKPTDLRNLPQTTTTENADANAWDDSPTNPDSSQISSDAEIRHRKLKSSWSFLSDDAATSAASVAMETSPVDCSDREVIDVKEISSSSASRAFTIDSTSTLSDAEDDVRRNDDVSLDDQADDAANDGDCFPAELLSEQDLSSVSTLCNAKASPPRILSSPDGGLLSKTSDLLVSDASPAVSLHSSTDVDDVTGAVQNLDLDRTPVSVSRFVNEHGISTADPSLIFRGPRTKSVSKMDRVPSQTDDATHFPREEEEHCFEVVEDAYLETTDVETDRKSAFSLFKRMASDHSRTLRYGINLAATLDKRFFLFWKSLKQESNVKMCFNSLQI